MWLTVLGCRSGMPADGQASSGYLVTTAGGTLLLDCGPGVATALSAVTRPERLSGVVISHLHLDHCYDLLPVGKTLLAASTPYPGEDVAPGEVAPVPLYVPEGGRDVLGRLAALFPVSTMPRLDQAFELAFDVREYAPGEHFALGDCEIDLYGLPHAAPNCGVRVTGPDGTLAYTGDTGPSDALATLADDAGLLLAEATLESTDTGPHGHLSASDAGRAAADAGVRRLVLTHHRSVDHTWLDARRADAARVYDGTIDIATPGAKYAVPSGTG